jgi:hypothetical protein
MKKTEKLAKIMWRLDWSRNNVFVAVAKFRHFRQTQTERHPRGSDPGAGSLHFVGIALRSAVPGRRRPSHANQT